MARKKAPAGAAAETPRRERILDAAEALFAEHGYDGVTLRQIATRAGVDVALANYHFGKKLDLFQAVFERRAALLNNPPSWGRRMMSRLFNGLVQEFIEALKKALPGAREEDIYWCYHNLSGALTLTLADTGRIDELSGGLCRSADFEAAYDHMIPFMAAGFRKVCASRH